MRHYRWTAMGMQETRFALAEPDTYVKSKELGRRVDKIRATEKRLAEEVESYRQTANKLAERVAALEAHMDGIRKILRSECADLGDNDWSDDLHLGDVVEKHLGRPARSRIEALEQENEQLRTGAPWLNAEARERERKLREVLEPILAAFAERVSAWERLSNPDTRRAFGGEIFPPPDTIDVTARFDVATLRALLEEEHV